MTTQYATTNGNNGTWTNGKRGGKRAFTLIEILIVVVILGVLAALVVPSVTSALDDAKTEAAEARGSQILTMVTRFNQFQPGGASISLPSSAGAITTTELDKLVKHVAAEAGIEPAQVPPVLADAWNQSHRRNRTVAVGWHEPSTRNSAVAA
jgi:prepilin-type N-terminal cleavage/methylation domain-containing protein